MNPLVMKPLMSSVNSLKVLVGARGCRVLKKTSLMLREDLVDEDTGDELIMSRLKQGLIYM